MGSQLVSPHGFVHRINPVVCEFAGVRLWYYGLAYAIGFLGIHSWFRWRRKELGWSVNEVYDFSILFALCALVFGRAFSIVVYQWAYYRGHLSQLFSYWRGGMASHGVLIGAATGTLLFSLLRNKRFLEVADEMVIPGAFFLACGRVGNFINGQIYGSVTNAWWAVKFPGAEGFRHPVTLYEALKNLAIVPILLLVRRRTRSGEGKLLAHFVFWYGFLRIITDLFREYGAEFLGLGRGQYFNIFMSLAGLAILTWRTRAYERPSHPESRCDTSSEGERTDKPRGGTGKRKFGVRLRARQAAFAALLCFSLIIRSGWTEGVLEQFRARTSQHGVFQHEPQKPQRHQGTTGRSLAYR